MNNAWIDAVPKVKKVVADHFKGQFGARNLIHPSLPVDMFQNQISDCDNVFLTAKFTLYEIRRECGSVILIRALSRTTSPSPFSKLIVNY